MSEPVSVANCCSADRNLRKRCKAGALREPSNGGESDSVDEAGMKSWVSLSRAYPPIQEAIMDNLTLQKQ